jgi:predicted flap endonuclease-1-like 5' DNA nuclease
VAAVVASASVAGAAVASLTAGGKEAAAERPSVPVASTDSDPKKSPGDGPSSGTTRSADRPATPVADVVAEPSDQGAPRGDVAYLHPVRSDGMRGSQSVFDARPGELDDLKRIRGIGVLIEKKLNSMGVTRYEQIAKWTSTDIDRVSHVLDFRGRIERENWVEQARILASGGQTEFSRRADRGEFGGV